MGIEKSEIRLATLKEVGKMLEEGQDSAQNEVHKSRGAISYLSRASRGIEHLNQIVSNDLDDGKLEFDSEFHASSYVSEIIEKAKNICVELSAQAEREALACAGRLQAMQASVKNVEKRFLAERTKLEQLAARLENPDLNGSRQVGEHPGSGLKSRRLEEEDGAVDVVFNEDDLLIE